MAERLATRDAAPAFYRSSPDRDNAPEHLERRAGPCFRAQLSINSRQLFYDAERFRVFSHSTGASSYVLVCALVVRGGAIALGRTPMLMSACGVADTQVTLAASRFLRRAGYDPTSGPHVARAVTSSRAPREPWSAT